MSGKVFRAAETDPYGKQAIVGGEYSVESDAYARGFYKLAHIGASHALNSFGRDKDELFFPILCNYRQYIELRLKSLIRFVEKTYHLLAYVSGICGNLTAIAGKQLLTHDLEILLDLLIQQLQLISDDATELYIEIKEPVLEYIREINNRDPNSQTFRYAYDRHQQLTLPNTEYIDLEHIQNIMEEVFNELEVIVDYLEGETDIGNERISFQEEVASSVMPSCDYEGNFY
ncbi:MAG: hypothetical protein QNJ63_00535 [Calothrix sp. MO_192.B10]|nr:hypothetical protein [Calothrix sp. MO_192.B10]